MTSPDSHVVGLGLLGGLSGEARTIAHLVLLLVVVAALTALAVVHVIRRRRAERCRERERSLE